MKAVLLGAVSSWLLAGGKIVPTAVAPSVYGLIASLRRADPSHLPLLILALERVDACKRIVNLL
jgi:hypothetical protein